MDIWLDREIVEDLLERCAGKDRKINWAKEDI